MADASAPAGSAPAAADAAAAAAAAKAARKAEYAARFAASGGPPPAKAPKPAKGGGAKGGAAASASAPADGKAVQYAPASGTASQAEKPAKVGGGGGGGEKPAAKRGAAAPTPATAPATVPNYELRGFAHIKPSPEDAPTAFTVPADATWHPAFATVAARIASCELLSTTEIAEAVCNACQALLSSYVRPASKVFAWHVNALISQQMELLATVETLAPGVECVVSYIRGVIMRLPRSLQDKEAVAHVTAAISEFVEHRLHVDAALSQCVSSESASAGRAGEASDASVSHRTTTSSVLRLSPGTRILTYGWSPAVEQLLLTAYVPAQNQSLTTSWTSLATSFSVCVLDSRPFHRGRRLVAALAGRDVPVTYADISSLQTAMEDVDVVILSAEAVDLRGGCLTAAGTTLVALAAKAASKPVYMLAETFKFVERLLPETSVLNARAPKASVLSGPRTTYVAKPPASLLAAAAGSIAKDAPAAGAGAGAGKKAAAATSGKAPAAPPSYVSSCALDADIAVPSSAMNADVLARRDFSVAVPHAAAALPASATTSTLALKYDATPANCITAFITEVGILVASQIRLVLREFLRLDEVQAAEEADDEAKATAGAAGGGEEEEEDAGAGSSDAEEGTA